MFAGMYNRYMYGGGGGNGQPMAQRSPVGRQAVHQGGGMPTAPAPSPTGGGATPASPMNYAQPVGTQAPVPAMNMNMGGGSGGGWNQYATQGMGGGAPYWQNAASQLVGAMPSIIGAPPGGAGANIASLVAPVAGGGNNIASILPALLSNPQIRAMLPSNYMSAFNGQAMANMPRFLPRYNIPPAYNGWTALAQPVLTQMR